MAEPYLSDAARRRMAGQMGAATTDPEAPGLTPMEAMMMAAGGPMTNALMRYPFVSALGYGMLNGMGGLNEAEAQQARAKANPNVPPEVRAAASKLPTELQGQYIDLATRAKTGISRAERETLNQLTGIIANSAKGADDAERQRLMDAGLRAEEARQRVMRDAPKTFQERFGDVASFVPVAPLIAAFGTTLPGSVVGSVGARRAASQWRDAANKGLNATDAPTLANQSALANAFEKKFPEPSIGNALAPYAIPAAIGGIEGAAIANIPDEWNASLPPMNPERAAYEAYLKELPANHPDYERAKRIYESLPETNPAREASLRYFQDGGQVFAKTAIGALQGAGGGALATTVGKWFAPSEKGLPRAQTQALRDRVAGTNIGPATGAIQAEGNAMGSVLPLPPPRPELAPAQAAPAPGYDPLAIQAQRVGKAAVPAAAAGAALAPGSADAADVNDPFAQELAIARLLIESMNTPQQFPAQSFSNAAPASVPSVPVNPMMMYR